MSLYYRLVISGSVPQAATELVRSRFDVTECTVAPASTVLTGRLADQPALRALLTLISDTGGRVVSLDTEVRHRTEPRWPAVFR